MILGEVHFKGFDGGFPCFVVFVDGGDGKVKFRDFLVIGETADEVLVKDDSALALLEAATIQGCAVDSAILLGELFLFGVFRGFFGNSFAFFSTSFWRLSF